MGDQYYLTAGTKVVCPECRAQVEGMPPEPLGPALGRSAALGLGGAILAAALWAAIVMITRLQLGIVAIGVGLLVGAAVRKGAGRRSGPLFQALAILLTVCSLAWSTLPMVYQFLAGKPGGLGYPSARAGAPVLRVKVARSHQIFAEGAPVTMEILKPRLEALSRQGGAVWYFREGKAEGEKPPAEADAVYEAVSALRIPFVPVEKESDLARNPSDPPPSSAVTPLRQVGGLVLFSFIVYAFSLKSDPFSAVFLLIALYEAWKLNRRRAVAFTGPHSRAEAIDFSTP